MLKETNRMDHALTEMPGLAGLVALLVELLLARAQQLLRAAAGAAAAARALAAPKQRFIYT